MYKVSAPGSLMLLGEHAVLYGQPAIVGAISQVISVELIARIDNKIVIESDRLGEYQTDLETLEITKPFDFVLSVIFGFKQHLSKGFNLNINSEFSDKIGFGSSAAVTAATVAVIGKYLNMNLSKLEVFKLGKAAILRVQNHGSGADLAASVFGGIIKYNVEPLEIKQLPNTAHLTAVYCGYKKPTPEVLAIVRENYIKNAKLFDKVFEFIGKCTLDAEKAIADNNLDALGKIFITHQKLIDKLGVNNNDLQRLITGLNSFDDIRGAKISGSGLGDCVVGLGILSKNTFPQDESQKKLGVCQFDLSITRNGINYCE